MTRQLLALVALILAGTGSVAAAEPLTEEFEIFCAERIEQAFGVILDDAAESPAAQLQDFVQDRKADGQSAAANSRPATAKQISVRVWRIAVQLQEEDYAKRRKLAAVALTNSGEIVSAEVRQLGEPKSNDVSVSLNCIPVESRDDYKALVPLNDEKLKAIADIREKKFEILIKVIRTYLESDAVLALQELERKHNLVHPNPITPEMSIHELTKRIAVLESFEAAKNGK